MKYIISTLIISVCLQSCNSDNGAAAVNETDETDSIELAIEEKVEMIIAFKDSLSIVPSLRFAKGEDETYTAKMYGKNQVTQYIREEHISNDFIVGRDYYYNDGELILIREEGSTFQNAVETYTEKLLYFKNNELYKSYEKNQFAEDNMFDDTLFMATTVNMSDIDLEKPFRALQQQGEFTMYFDQFLLIDPQSYLIVENSDRTINAALYIVEGDSVLNILYENPEANKGKKLWLYHSFEDMNGIERMIYEGAVFLKD